MKNEDWPYKMVDLDTSYLTATQATGLFRVYARALTDTAGTVTAGTQHTFTFDVAGLNTPENITVEDSADYTEFSYFVKTVADITSVPGKNVEFSFVPSTASAAANIGPLEMLIDVPVMAGCFRRSENYTMPTGTPTTVPTACIASW